MTESGIGASVEAAVGATMAFSNAEEERRPRKLRCRRRCGVLVSQRSQEAKNGTRASIKARTGALRRWRVLVDPACFEWRLCEQQRPRRRREGVNGRWSGGSSWDLPNISACVSVGACVGTMAADIGDLSGIGRVEQRPREPGLRCWEIEGGGRTMWDRC